MGINNCGYSTLTVTGTSQIVWNTCSPVMPGQAEGAVISLEAAQIRWRDDGTAPTATEGHLLNPGAEKIYDSWTVPKNNWKQPMRALRVIRVGGSNGLLKISWYD